MVILLLVVAQHNSNSVLKMAALTIHDIIGDTCIHHIIFVGISLSTKETKKILTMMMIH